MITLTSSCYTFLMRYRNFTHLLQENTANHPDDPVFLYDDDGKKTITWKEFNERVTLRAKELRMTDRTSLGILCDGSLENVIEIFAGNNEGMQNVLLDKNAPLVLLAKQINATDVDLLWGGERVKELLPFLTKGTNDTEDQILFFTSGTTNAAKAVTLTSASLMASAWNGGQMLPLQEDDILLNLLPLNHVFGFVCGLLWGMSCHAVTALGRGMRHFVDDPAYFRPTAVSLVPLLTGFFLQHNLFNPELRQVLIGAGDCREELIKAMQQKNIKVAFGYGLTETSSGVAISTSGNPKEMDICPDDEITLALDGEILIKAPTCMMKGYYKKPEETREVLKDGILYTGDLGRFTEEGKLVITGRKKDILLLPNGTKIFLPEIEAGIMNLLQSQEVAVVLKNDKPVLVTHIEKKKEEIRARLSETIKNMPRGQQFTDIIELPHPLQRTASGKIKRWEIQKEIEKL